MRTTSFGLTSARGWPIIIEHIQAFVGELWYVKVAAEGGADTNSGTDPHNAFATIGAAIAAASAGDAITVKNGTYDEGLTINKTGLELWGEIGAIITNSTPGTCVTISADYVRFRGFHVIQAGQVGILVSGNVCSIEQCGIEDCTTGYSITGDGNYIRDSYSMEATVTGFDISGEECHLDECLAIGTGGSTRGFYLSANTADSNNLKNCDSVGNGTSGFEIIVGADSNAIINCTSGAGDGRWVDGSSSNTWPNFTFDSELFHTTIFAGGGGGSDNLFLVTGTVQINRIFGDIITALNADVDNCKLELWDGGGTDITAIVDLSAAPLESFIGKTGAIGAALGYESSAAAALIDWIAELSAGFTVVAKRGTATYIRLNYTGVATDGAIRWHCRWSPLTEEGFVTAV